MTSRRRTRKNSTRRNHDDDSYTQRYRKASDGAKAARAAAAGRAREADRGSGEEAGSSIPREVGSGARIKAISLVAEGGTGYVETDEDFSRHVDHIEEAGEGHTIHVGDEGNVLVIHSLEGGTWEEALRAEAASHAAALGQREAEGAAEVHVFPARESRTVFEEVQDVDELAQAANQGGDILLAVLAAKEHAETEYKRRHQVFLEAEVNGLPTHVGSFMCYCEKAANHWQALGAI